MVSVYRVRECLTMLKGTVRVRARIKGDGLKFSAIVFDPRKPGVDKVEINGPNGREIESTVYLTCVETPQAGLIIARDVIDSALNRISFAYNTAIEGTEISFHSFEVAERQPRHLSADLGNMLKIEQTLHGVLTKPPESVKAMLEQAPISGEQHFSLFRLARQSRSRVEEFMTHYNLLLMLHNDEQVRVDDFIRGEDASVVETPKPTKKSSKRRTAKQSPNETIYTRLRNEMAHIRDGVDLRETKVEIENCLGDLIKLTKRAINLSAQLPK